MTKISAETVQNWMDRADAYLTKTDYTIADVREGAHAWALANILGFTREAYEDRTVVDAHIKTALQKVFPDAVFKDRYTY